MFSLKLNPIIAIPAIASEMQYDQGDDRCKQQQVKNQMRPMALTLLFARVRCIFLSEIGIRFRIYRLFSNRFGLFL